MLRQIKQAGELGQFRTPRHLIRRIVERSAPLLGVLPEAVPVDGVPDIKPPYLQQASLKDNGRAVE